MVTKGYGVECFNCRHQIELGIYTVEKAEQTIDVRLPEGPILCDACGEGSIYSQDRLIHFLAGAKS